MRIFNDSPHAPTICHTFFFSSSVSEVLHSITFAHFLTHPCTCSCTVLVWEIMFTFLNAALFLGRLQCAVVTCVLVLLLPFTFQIRLLSIGSCLWEIPNTYFNGVFDIAALHKNRRTCLHKSGLS